MMNQIPLHSHAISPARPAGSNEARLPTIDEILAR